MGPSRQFFYLIPTTSHINFTSTSSSFTNTTNNAKMVKAVATVRGDSKVSGTVTFEQASESSPTTITWDITGNDPNAERGMHVHQFGDNTNGCTSAGPTSTLTARRTVLLPTRPVMLVTWATSRPM